MKPEMGPKITPPAPEAAPVAKPEIPKAVSPEKITSEKVTRKAKKAEAGSVKMESVEKIKKQESQEINEVREDLDKLYEGKRPPKVEAKYAREEINPRKIEDNEFRQAQQKPEIYNEPKNDWEALGLEGDVFRKEEIDRAYRQKVSELHPDKHPGEEKIYEKSFKRVQEAYENLLKPAEVKAEIISPEELSDKIIREMTDEDFNRMVNSYINAGFFSKRGGEVIYDEMMRKREQLKRKTR